MKRLPLFMLVLLLLCLGTLRAEAVTAAQERGENSPAIEVFDGDTLLLKNGREVGLVAIQAPKLLLEGVALSKTLTLYYGGRKTNCWRREWCGITAFATTAV